jgi:putative phosphoribosyl transferase
MPETRQIAREEALEIAPAGIVGDLVVPIHPGGVVVFAHGSGSSRLSTRNRFVARVLQENGFATLLLDLLTAAEEEVDLQTRELRFDIGLLAERLASAVQHLHADAETADLPIGFFGASTGGGAALLAAARLSVIIRAVVSRGGRPDLAGDALERVLAPTLLIVGGLDLSVIELNQKAMKQLSCEKKLEIVANATHLFEEPGAMEKVTRLAVGWFVQHLPKTAAASG